MLNIWLQVWMSIIQDIVHIGFTGIIATPSGSDTIEHFNSIVFGNVSTNGVSGPFNPISLTGPVTVTLFGYTTGQLGTFNTEMTQLDLSGPGVMLQESPTKASTGQTKIEAIGGGLFPRLLASLMFSPSCRSTAGRLGCLCQLDHTLT